MTLPADDLVKRLLQYLVAAYKLAPIPVLEVAELKLACGISDVQFWSLVHHFHNKAFQLVGRERLQIDKAVLQYEPRLQRCTFNDAMQFFNGIKAKKRRRRMVPIFAAIAAHKQTPCLTLKAVLEFGEKIPDGRLVEAVALPWFEIMRMISDDPHSIYEINPYTWEEIIAGAYVRAGFDEVILTPRSGDNGRDIVATKRGIGSIRFFDQVKAYKPGHLVTAEEVRAMVGTLCAAGNVSKGVVTTTSDFAPRITTHDFVKGLIPYRLELKARQDLLDWLDGLADQD